MTGSDRDLPSHKARERTQRTSSELRCRVWAVAAAGLVALLAAASSAKPNESRARSGTRPAPTIIHCMISLI